MFIHVYMANNLWNFIVTYKKYLLVVLVTILCMLALITLFGPTNINSDLLSKKQIKQLKAEKAQLLELTKRQMDSVIFYKNAADVLSGVIDSSKTVTIYIKSETNEEVNNIKFAPVDSNIIKFKSDLEFYISNK
jgi:hypothetical protein